MSGLFNDLADAGRAKAKAVCDVRGAEYRDSWKDTTWPVLRAVLKELKFGYVPADSDLRCLALAAMIDIKIARFGGGFKEDTCDDLVNYVAALREAMWTRVDAVYAATSPIPTCEKCGKKKIYASVVREWLRNCDCVCESKCKTQADSVCGV